MSREISPKSVGRVFQANYNKIFSATGQCKVCLTKGEIQWILSQADYAAWPTRWTANEGTEIDRRVIAEFHAKLIRKLMTVCIPCEGDEMYLLRQNPANPCQLQQSTDEGETWTLAFDYELCMYENALNPPIERINPDTGELEWSIDDGETWQPAPTPQTKTPLTTDVYASKDDPACWHTYNAVELMHRMLMDTGDDLLLLVDVILSLLLTIITGGATLPILVTNLVSAILAAGIGEAREQMTEDRWQELREIIYCKHDQPGGWSFGAFGEIYDDVATKLPFPASLAIQSLLSTMGYIGMTNAGHLHLVDTVTDCLSFECVGCGFITNTGEGNWEKWSLLTTNDLYDWEGTALAINNDGTKFFANGYFGTPNQVLSIQTEFEEPCFVASVKAYNLGTPNANRMVIGYKVGGVWTLALNEVAAGHSGADAWDATIGHTVEAVGIQYSGDFAEITSVTIE